jgi:hypothetical protein
MKIRSKKKKRNRTERGEKRFDGRKGMRKKEKRA